MYTKTVIQLN